jgi:hypothetical protein
LPRGPFNVAKLQTMTNQLYVDYIYNITETAT